MTLSLSLLRLAFGALLLLTLHHAIAAEPQRVTSVEGVTEYRLDNGLKVLMIPDSSVDSVMVHITYLVGSRHEGYGEKGMAHLLEHMLFKGTPANPKLKEDFSRRGVRFNGSTSHDRTNYYETLAASRENLDWALGVEADRMVNAYVRKSDLDSEMTVVRNEFEAGENNPGGVLRQRMMQLAFGWHNYGNSVIGARSDIENVPIGRLQAFYRTYYQPDNAVLVIGGNFDEREALGMVARHFGKLPRPARELPGLYTTEPTQDGERSVVLRRAGDTQMIGTLYRVPSGGHQDYPAIDVLVHVLATQPTGRLHLALVQKGLASTIWGGESALHDPGIMFFGAVLRKTAPLEPAREALLSTTEQLLAEPVREDEVARAKIALLNDFDKTQTDSLALVSSLSEFSASGDWRLFYLYRDRLRKVTVEDVRRVAGIYLKPANRVMGTFIPTDQPVRAEIPPVPDLAKALDGYTGGKVPILGDAFDPSPANIEARLIRKTLPNGIRIALLPKKTRGGNVVATLALHWGDEAAKMNRSTACTLADGMLMKGTLKHSRAEIQEALEKLNANVTVSTEGAGIDTQRPQLAAALRLVAEVLKEPSFSASEFAQLKQAAITRAESQRSDPSAIAGERIGRYLSPYPKGHWAYVQTAEERIEALKQTSLADAERCYRDFVGATRAEFAAIGDFDPDEVTQLVEELFGAWKSPRGYERIPARYFDRPGVQDEVRTPDKANAVLRLGANLKVRDDNPDFPALVLGNYLLGGTSTARLSARVREKEGLSYGTYSSFTASQLDESASFGVSSIYAPQNKTRVESAVREEIAHVLRDGYTEEELAAGKSGLLQSRRAARIQDRNLIGRVSMYLFIDRTFAWDIEFEKQIAALTPAQVRDAMRRHLDPAKMAVVKAGDFKE